jgi:WD40 repeat protein
MLGSLLRPLWRGVLLLRYPIMRLIGMFLAVVLVPAVMAAEPGPSLKLLVTVAGAHPAGLSTVAFSPDGKTLAVSDHVIREDGQVIDSIKLWDVANRKVSATLLGGRPAADAGTFSVAFSPDGKTLAAAGADLTLWDVATGKKTASFKGGRSVAFSPDGKTLAALDGEEESEVTVWDLATRKAKVTFKGHAGESQSLCGPLCVAFSPDGKIIATGWGKSGSEGRPSGGDVTLWDVATGRERASLKEVVKLKVTLHSLSSLRADGVPKGVLLKLAALNGREIQTEEDVDKEIDKLLDKDQREKYLDLVRREVQTNHEGHMVHVWSVAFSPDGKTLVSGDVYGNVVLWDVESGKRTATLQRFNPRGRDADINSVYSVTFSPDGKTLVAGTLHGIKLWDVESGEEIRGLKQPLDTVYSVAFSPDGKTIASAGSKAVFGIKNKTGDEPALRLWEWTPLKKADK